MPVRVRVQNVQSIEDETVEIDFLTVITGANNSGKTAFIRAVRGVFTNAPAGPLVRHGAAHLTVTITFSDGTEVVWEKGWEKPDQKGKTINRYRLNGTWLNDVGKGVPPEIAGLGVSEIPAGSERLWPQVADQIVGSLFLINNSGSAVAEALSDVEKVGKLTEALRMVDRDRRQASTELKLRKKDVQDAKEKVAGFDGLDGVAAQVKGLSTDTYRTLYEEIAGVMELKESYDEASRLVRSLQGFDAGALSGSGAAQILLDMQKDLRDAKALLARHKVADDTLTSLVGFDGVAIPDEGKLRRVQSLLRTLRAMATQRDQAADTTSLLRSFQEPAFPDGGRPHKIQVGLTMMKGLQQRYADAQSRVTTLDGEWTQAEQKARDYDQQVSAYIAEQGYCPTCKTTSHTHQHGAAHHE